MSISYKDTGVNIDAGNESVDLIKSRVKESFNSSVLNNIGGFGALFQPNLDGIKEPVIVSSTDGVGTKILIAIKLDKHQTVGIDLVAMSVNDLICTGAKPLFFLDYIACGKLIPEKVSALVDGITTGCIEASCALIGGETAEMPDMYKPDEYDLAGFAVGIVDKTSIIDGSKIKIGDSLIGIPSSGIHSNGYSLARKVLLDQKLDDSFILSNLEKMLIPTKIYVKDVSTLVTRYPISGIAHITGGGLYEKLGRIIPIGFQAFINEGSWKVLDIFKEIQELGDINKEEMFRVFNMGIGMVIATDKDSASDILKQNPDYCLIGSINKGEQSVVID